MVNHGEASHRLWHGKIQIIILSPSCAFSDLRHSLAKFKWRPIVLIGFTAFKTNNQWGWVIVSTHETTFQFYSQWSCRIGLALFKHSLINGCVTKGIAHFSKVFLWDRTKITPSHCKADNGLPTPAILRTHSRSAGEVCVFEYLSMKDRKEKTAG